MKCMAAFINLNVTLTKAQIHQITNDLFTAIKKYEYDLLQITLAYHLASEAEVSI